MSNEKCLRIFFGMGRNDILTVDEVAKVMKVSLRTVYRWISSGDLRTARLGRKTYRVFSGDLVHFVRAKIR